MTKNFPSTQAQRSVITNRGAKTPFNADVRLVTCVHGRMDENDPTPASLVVLEYRVLCMGVRHRYNRLNTRLAIQSQVAKDLKDEPFVPLGAYAPFQHSRNIDAIEVEHTKEWEAGASAGASFTPATASINLSRESEKNYKLESCAVGKAFPEHTPGKSGTDAIVWELQENKMKKVGVPDSFRVALLIQRADSDRFLGHFFLKLHAGIWHALTEKFRDVFGVVEPDDPLIFDPSEDPQGETAGITATRLGEYRDAKKLESLCPISSL